MQYFTADLHLGHNGVAKRRGFADADEMNNFLIRQINARVTRNDELWILGDFSYRISKEEARERLRQIVCRDIHLIRGNHDKDWSTEDGFASVEDYRELKTGRTTDAEKIILCHYPLAEWDGMRHGACQFHGHIHGNQYDNQMNALQGIQRYDVGVDANPYKTYMPESLDEIIGRMVTWLKEGKDMTYSIRLAWSDDDYCYLAAIPEIPGCIADGTTPETAVWNLRKVRDIILADYLRTGETIPEPRHYDVLEEVEQGFWNCDIEEDNIKIVQKHLKK